MKKKKLSLISRDARATRRRTPERAHVRKERHHGAASKVHVSAVRHGEVEM
jgi:hypothetical protein